MQTRDANEDKLWCHNSLIHVFDLTYCVLSYYFSMNKGQDSVREGIELEIANNTINRLYNKLKQGYYKELFVSTGDISLYPFKKPKSRIKMFPSLPKNNQSSAEDLENYLTSYQKQKPEEQI